MEMFDDSLLNCIYGGALGLGLIYSLILIFFQGAGEIFDGLTDVLGMGGDIDIDTPDDGIGISMLAVSFFVSAFGAFGLTGTGLGAGAIGSLIIALIGGFILGGIGQVLFVYLLSPTTSSMVNQATLVGKSAEVVLPIPENGAGQIALVSSGGRVTYTARSTSGTAINRGTEVRIEKIIGSVAHVTPTDEYEI